MEHGNGWCFRGIYKGGLWEDDLHVSAHIYTFNVLIVYFRFVSHVFLVILFMTVWM